MDIVNKNKRFEIMERIKSKDTKPELIISKWLHSYGFRYMLYDKHLSGKSDIILPKYNAVIFIIGYFLAWV